MVEFLTGIASPIWAAYRDSARMCLSLDSPVLLLILPCDLLLMQRFLHLPGRQWKSGYPGCCQDEASRRNRTHDNQHDTPSFLKSLLNFLLPRERKEESLEHLHSLEKWETITVEPEYQALIRSPVV
jgi:hypothetical protein